SEPAAMPRRDEMTLQDRLDAFKADFEAGKPPYNVPPSVIATMHRATAELIASGQAERAKRAGDIVPSFTLDHADGRRIHSAELQRRSAVDAVDAGPLHHRERRHDRLRRGQPGLHQATRPVRAVARARQARRAPRRLIPSSPIAGEDRGGGARVLREIREINE